MSSTTTAPANNPVASFYGGNRAVRWLGAALRTAHRVAPALGTRLTMRLFFTPMPPKWVSRRQQLPQAWRVDSLPFDGGKLAVWRHTDIEATAERPRVLLVHGWAGDALQMRTLGDALHAAGFEPVLLDFPGHGRSDGWRSTLPRFAQPTLVIHDRDDRVAPQAVSERLVRLLPRGELSPTEGLGHRRLLGDAGVAAAVIAHLQIGDTRP